VENQFHESHLDYSTTGSSTVEANGFGHGRGQKTNGGMDATCKTKDLSQPAFSETVNGGTVYRKAARTGLWGSGEATNRSIWNQYLNELMNIQRFKQINFGDKNKTNDLISPTNNIL
jgi:hypothetical protein